jgi:hypothetical protein
MPRQWLDMRIQGQGKPDSLSAEIEGCQDRPTTPLTDNRQNLIGSRHQFH